MAKKDIVASVNQSSPESLMHKTVLSLAVLVASFALLIFSIGDSFAYPQGPNVSLGSNPIISFQCGSSGYTVPNGQDFIITDFIGASSYPSIYVDGVSAMYIGFNGNSSLNTGWKIAAGSTVSCVSGTVYLSGYLTHS